MLFEHITQCDLAAVLPVEGFLAHDRAPALGVVNRVMRAMASP
jgi:hypothetical protein